MGKAVNQMTPELHFATFKSFLQMGGYAAYVWPAYIITFAGLFINIILSFKQRRQIRRQLQGQYETAA